MWASMADDATGSRTPAAPCHRAIASPRPGLYPSPQGPRPAPRRSPSRGRWRRSARMRRTGRRSRSRVATTGPSSKRKASVGHTFAHSPHIVHPSARIVSTPRGLPSERSAPAPPTRNDAVAAGSRNRTRSAAASPMGASASGAGASASTSMSSSSGSSNRIRSSSVRSPPRRARLGRSRPRLHPLGRTSATRTSASAEGDCSGSRLHRLKRPTGRHDRETGHLERQPGAREALLRDRRGAAARDEESGLGILVEERLDLRLEAHQVGAGQAHRVFHRARRHAGGAADAAVLEDAGDAARRLDGVNRAGVDAQAAQGESTASRLAHDRHREVARPCHRKGATVARRGHVGASGGRHRLS